MRTKCKLYSLLTKAIIIALGVSFGMNAKADVLKLKRTITAPQGSVSYGTSLATAGSHTVAALRSEGDDGYPRFEPYLIDARTGDVARILGEDLDFRKVADARAVDIDETRALVCGMAEERGEKVPSARLYDTATGALLMRFKHLDAKSYRTTHFGHACQLSGNTVVITDNSIKGIQDTSQGAVYLFDSMTGGLIKRIVSHDPDEKAHFGKDAVINDNLIAISSTGMDSKRGYIGHVDLYDLDTGTHLNRFERPPNGIPHNNGSFGATLAMDNSRLVIGSVYDTLKSKRQTGTVWVYDLSDYKLLHQFVAPEGRPKNNLFGTALALWGDLLLVGAPDITLRDVTAKKTINNTGRAFLFDLEIGALTQEFPNPGAQSKERFGQSVSLGPEGAVISASTARTKDTTRGAIYVYTFAAP